MTTGMSLHKWEKLGQLDREISIYSKLSEQIGQIDIYTYGRNESYMLKKIQTLDIGIEKKIKFLKQNHKSPRIQSYFNYLWNIYNLILKYKYFNTIDIVKTNQFSGSVFGILIKMIFNKPLIIRMGFYHGHFNNPTFRNRQIEKLVFKNCDRIILTNKLAKKYICTEYNISSDLVNVIPNSIDTDLFSPNTCNKEYDIAYIGRLQEVKNLELLKAALDLINEPLNLLIIGDGDMKILEKIKSVNSHDIDYYKWLPNYKIPNFLNKSKLFVLLSKYEGNPKALLEAMSCRLPVIGNNVPGISDIINSKKWIVDK